MQAVAPAHEIPFSTPYSPVGSVIVCSAQAVPFKRMAWITFEPKRYSLPP